MTTLATGDLHFSANPRDAYRWKFLEETLPALARAHAVTRLLILGDLTEQKDGHPATLVNRLVDGLAAIAARLNIYVLRGNHDYRAEDVPFFRFLDHVPRVRWINDPIVLNLRGLGYCRFIPHQADRTFWEKPLKGGCDWTFCHETFEGAAAEGGHQLSGLSRTAFPRGARVISGDVHKPQVVGKMVTYVGAPYTVDHGDAYEPRVLILNNHEMKSVPVPGPQKRLLVIRDMDPLRTLMHRTARTGDIIKVRVDLPPSAEVSRTEVRAAVRNWAEREGILLAATEVLAPRGMGAGGREAQERRRASDPDLVRAYAKKMGAGKGHAAAGLKIVEEVQ